MSMMPSADLCRQGSLELAELPLQLGELLTEAGLRDVVTWWLELDFSSRRQVHQLWADCIAANAGQHIVACVEGEFVEDEEMDDGGFWHQELYNYLVNHELHFDEDHHRYFFQGCTQHPLAKAAIAAGRIPSNFTCGLDATSCPMKKILAVAPGKTMRLRLGFR
jgi:hypothetical protein